MSVKTFSKFLPLPVKWRRASRNAATCAASVEPVEATLIIDEPKFSKKRKRKGAKESPALKFLDLPDELLLLIVEELSAGDLAFVDLTSHKLRFGTKLEPRWRLLYEADFNGGGGNGDNKDCVATPRQQCAAALAGSWKALYRARLERDREARKAAAPGELPWEAPCKWELQVALDGLMAGVPVSGKGYGTSVMFLLDGSGSVTEEDFSTMSDFIGTALDSILATHPATKVGVLQFSNDVRVEIHPQTMDREAFDKKLQAMTRINGGTNISLAISKAGQLLKTADAELLAQRLAAAPAQPPPPETEAEAPEHSSRVLVLLTDGRVDAYQAHEAVVMMERLADEQANVSLHAFGVGRGVDKTELLRIVAACGADAPEERYTGLRVLDEAPW